MLQEHVSLENVDHSWGANKAQTIGGSVLHWDIFISPFLQLIVQSFLFIS